MPGAVKKKKEHFIVQVEKSIYEGEPVSDEEIEAECRLWARTLPHLRVCGKSIGETRHNEMKAMKEAIIDCLIENYLWNPFLDTVNNELHRKRSQSEAPICRTGQDHSKVQNHQRLPAISGISRNHLSLSKISLK